MIPRPRAVYFVSASSPERYDAGLMVGFKGGGDGESMGRQHGQRHSGSIGLKSVLYRACRRLRTPEDVIAFPKRCETNNLASVKYLFGGSLRLFVYPRRSQTCLPLVRQRRLDPPGSPEPVNTTLRVVRKLYTTPMTYLGFPSGRSPVHRLTLVYVSKGQAHARSSSTTLYNRTPSPRHHSNLQLRFQACLAGPSLRSTLYAYRDLARPND